MQQHRFTITTRAGGAVSVAGDSEAAALLTYCAEYAEAWQRRSMNDQVVIRVNVRDVVAALPARIDHMTRCACQTAVGGVTASELYR